MRLFIALDLPEYIKRELVLLNTDLPQARWVPAVQLHLTLRFIGELDETFVEDLKAALAVIRFPSFPLSLKGLGCFPSRRNPQVLWVGLEKSVALMALRKKVEIVLVKFGVTPDPRQFSPHITLARTRKTPSALITTFLNQYALFHLPKITVSSFHLYSSILSSKGAWHRHEAEFLLEDR
ncbi:MAG: RNA 2',3'-cyclic phosphodiesterase [Deltaproteobacteria bacterium]|nr:RNA 2',3'-cyclic phosphodiesterase [Deltaproteobacteria bacterium]